MSKNKVQSQKKNRVRYPRPAIRNHTLLKSGKKQTVSASRQDLSLKEKKQSRYIIGIDGGGTKTVALLASESGDVIAEEVGDATNLNVIGFDQAIKTILQLIKTVSSKESKSLQNLDVIVLGLSGAGRPKDQDRVSEGLRKLARSSRLKFNRIIVETDARIALEGGLRGAPGIIMIAGTGSIAFGKDTDGTIYRVGGWGRCFGDEGSGYFLGRKALTAIARHIDGRGEPTVLKQMVEKEFSLDSQDALITSVYAKGFDVASLAPLVIEAARQGDRVAEKILIRGASEIEEHLRVLVGKMDSSQKINTVLIGGLFINDSYYQKVVMEKIAGSLPHVHVQPSMASGAYGAILMGLAALKDGQKP